MKRRIDNISKPCNYLQSEQNWVGGTLFMAHDIENNTNLNWINNM